jgi:small subunit ribosomal protein S8
MIARIRNAHMALHKEVRVPRSKMKKAIAQILVDEGYIQSFEETEREIQIRLKYVTGKPAIKGMARASKPSRRRYVKAKETPNVQSGLGINILSTPQGVLAGYRAQQENVGGELLCQIW